MFPVRVFTNILAFNLNYELVNETQLRMEYSFLTVWYRKILHIGPLKINSQHYIFFIVGPQVVN